MKAFGIACVIMALFWLPYLIPWDDIFVSGEESFTALLRDPNHLAFEAITGIGQTIVIDVVGLALVWPLVKRHFHQDIEQATGVDIDGDGVTHVAGFNEGRHD